VGEDEYIRRKASVQGSRLKAQGSSKDQGLKKYKVLKGLISNPGLQVGDLPQRTRF
jgi:hypothetical protein